MVLALGRRIVGIPGIFAAGVAAAFQSRLGICLLVARLLRLLGCLLIFATGFIFHHCSCVIAVELQDVNCNAIVTGPHTGCSGRTLI